MRQLRAFIYRVTGLFGRARRERDLAEELESHVALAADEGERRGLDPAEARRQAVIALGGIESTKEAYRDRRSVPFIETSLQDLRYAARLLRRSPGFAATTILTLAMGIGSTTAVFTVADGVWLKALPVAKPNQLVSLEAVSPRGEPRNISYPLFRLLRDNEPALLAGMYAELDGAYRLPVTGIGSDAPPSEARVQLVSGEYFGVLGVGAFAGRVLTPDDDRVPSGHAVAVVSHAFWTRRLRGDPAAVGTYLRIKDHSFLIVGIAPPGFFGDAVGLAPDAWAPLMMQPTLTGPRSLLENDNVGWLRIMGRLREGATVEQARKSITATLARLNQRTTFQVLDAKRGLPEFQDRVTPLLRILAGVVVIVLLVGCANVASLLLARTRGRMRELAMRQALGASRRRLIRQFLTEGTVLAVAACILGVGFAWWSARVLLILLSNGRDAIAIHAAPNARILTFALGLSAFTVLLFALAPALLALQRMRSWSLNTGLARQWWPRLGRGLIAVQVTLSLLVMNSAGLLVRTLQNLRTLDLGYQYENLIQLQFNPDASGLTASEVPEISRSILDRLSKLPGVLTTTSAHSGFATGISRTCCIVVSGHDFQVGEDREVATLGVAPGYFRAIGLPLLQGRDFLPRESTADPRRMPPVVIVNEEFVRRYVEAGSAIGRRLGWGDDSKRASLTLEIVGVAKDATYDELRQRPRPLLYFPSTAGTHLLIRASTHDGALIAAVRREIRAIDPRLEIKGPSAVADDVEHILVRERMLAALSTALGAIAALLAAIGIFGLAEHTVAARTPELGLRMALGASASKIWQTEIWTAMWLCSIGIAVGVPLALGGGRLIRAELFGVSSSDPFTLIATSALLLALAVGAAFVPAKRASSVDPLIALRCD